MLLDRGGQSLKMVGCQRLTEREIVCENAMQVQVCYFEDTLAKVAISNYNCCEILR